jgi:RHS repeat-associated protein
MGPGALYWPLTDYQGSVRELLDASGAVVKQYRYDSFGARSVVSGSSAVDEFFAYTGQARDPESGLQQHWHRYYDPPTGRWLSVDPVPDDTNQYRYVHNRPTNAIDPSGLAEKEVEIKHAFRLNASDSKKTPVMFKLSVTLNGDNSLTIKLQEGKDFDKEARQGGFPFDAVVAGAHTGRNAKFQDTDSVQVAVRWENQKGEDVGHETNAKAPGKRPVGAEWKFTGSEEKKDMVATWTTKTKAPAEAVQMEVIILYTDALYEHPDLSLIIGSFSAMRKDDKTPWTIKDNPGDMFQPVLRRDEPRTEEQIAKAQKNTEDILLKKTGYKLKHRLEVNTYYDTGYDIIIRK